MIVYPNAKINLGLHVTEKRADGFHNLETVFYPVGWSDLLELLPGEAQERGVKLSVSGLPIPGDTNDNLCVRAYELISRDYPMPAVKAHLHKNVPMGAGLGGGSSDAAFFIRALNDLFELGLAWGELHHYAKQLGSDCSFFIANRPVIAEGKGDEYESLALDLSAYHLAVAYPAIHVSTPEAYRGIVPKKPARSLEQLILETPLHEWKNVIKNDFEESVFKKFPAIGALKEKMYAGGAIYASMSGSGSAVYGIFEEAPALEFSGCTMWSGKL